MKLTAAILISVAAWAPVAPAGAKPRTCQPAHTCPTETSAPPASTTAPSISGVPESGQTLSADPGQWATSLPATYRYDWRRCDLNGGNCVATGSTGASFAVTAADVSLTVRVVVTATSSAGSTSAASAPTAQITVPAAAPVPSTVWTPSPSTTWQLQLTGTIDQTVDVAVYDIDLFDNDSATVGSLHSRGRKAICYFSAGSWENWRPDAASFPASIIGNTNGWPGEHWLDIRRLDVLGPIMEARLDVCKQKGFDAADPDNVDGYTNLSGFPLTADDQLRYNRFLSDAAHRRGLSVGLKNDLGQAAALVSSFDWALNEQCFRYNECSLLTPFVDAGKAVFQVEYGTDQSFCSLARALRLSSIQKNLDLDAWRIAC